jgi:penicillin-binding protein 1A
MSPDTEQGDRTAGPDEISGDDASGSNGSDNGHAAELDPPILRGPAAAPENGAPAPPPVPPIPPKPPSSSFDPSGTAGDGDLPTTPRIKRLRVFFVLFGLSILAGASAVFGTVMAVSQDLPAIERYAQFKEATNSVVKDSQGKTIGIFSNNENRTLLKPDQISTNMKNAVVALEDKRFYEHRGVDYQGLARAIVQDIVARSAKQGASTITQQLVKQAMEAQDERTVFQKVKEISLSYHIEREWTKDKILTEYLNSIYFGSGAYGIEAASRAYFSNAHPDCGIDTEPCAKLLTPAEAALLAGIIQNPSGYDPRVRPAPALQRRNIVLLRMYEQGFISRNQYDDARAEALPPPSEIEPPAIESEAPYFTSWVRQQVVDRFGAGRTFFGGLEIKTSIDLEVQGATEEAVQGTLSGVGPTASVVVLNNRNATIDAMVGGFDFENRPFNLATQGYRQPGSTVKPFVLAAALEQGISPDSVFTSEPQLFRFGKNKRNFFPVKNYGDSYLGSATLRTATTNSDNAIYAQLGLDAIEGGPKAIARLIRRMGVWDEVQANPAMVLGTSEVTPLQWTYAFMTLANDGKRVSGSLAPDPGDTPVAYTKVTDKNGRVIRGGRNEVLSTQVIDPVVAQTTREMLGPVITGGTGKSANVGDPSQWGKTGTTDNNSNAWFCGALSEVTACVWVGYPDGYKEMTTEFGGSPVDGGTYPAIIWAKVMRSWLSIESQRILERESELESESLDADGDSPAPVVPEISPAPASPPPISQPAPSAPAPAPPQGGGSGGGTSSGGTTPG